MTRPAPALAVTPEQRKVLEALSVSRTASLREVQRANALLLAADGVANLQIAAQIGTTPTTVRSWRRQFEHRALVNFAQVAPGRGRKRSIPDDVIARIIDLTQNSTPADRPQWSTRAMAEHIGVSKDTVHRVWTEHGLKPHLFKPEPEVVDDPAEAAAFEGRLVDVVGLYLNPPQQVLALCMDEESGARALEQAPEPAVADHAEKAVVPDRLRSTTDLLFSTLHELVDTMPASTGRQRPAVFVRFLEAIEAELPPGLEVRLVLNSYSVHKYRKVQSWLAKRPWFHLQFTLASSSWLGLAERWTRELAQMATYGEDFRSVPPLTTAIRARIEASDETMPFAWTAKTLAGEGAVS